MAIKGCWTCRARKVKCDLNTPACDKCTKAHRTCRGYGVQLSWPRETDKRRAVVNHLIAKPRATSQVQQKGGRVFLNTSHWDVSLSDALLERRDLALYFSTLKVPHLPYLPSSNMGGSNILLLDFFIQSKSQILTPIIDEALAQFIMRVALSNFSTSNNLALKGILTIASLQLQGELKSRTHQNQLISMLRGNLIHGDKESLLQNLIATMLLYQFEICMMTNPKKIWSIHLCGAKKLIASSTNIHELYKDDTAIIMDWIYYHEIVSEFSLRYWAKASSIDSFCKGPLAIHPNRPLRDGFALESRITCPIEVLDLIRIICKRPLVFHGDEALYDDKADFEHTLHLKHSLQAFIGENGTFHDSSEGSLTRHQKLAYLYRCAGLIYLNRAVLKTPTTSFQHRRLIREGILVLQDLGFCESAWPILILAFEAIEDGQRLAILGVLSRTEQEPLYRSNHVPLVQRIVEMLWSQIDLGVDSDIEYSQTMYAVISTAPSLPLFA